LNSGYSDTQQSFSKLGFNRVRACLAYSVNDPAGSGIAKAILTLVEYVPMKLPLASESYEIPRLNAVLAGFNEDVLYFEFLDEVCLADFYLVLSRHSSEAGVKSFTVHHPGNPMRTAVAGGRPLELPPSNPLLSRRLLVSLARRVERMPGFVVSYEVTHHGPSSLRKPVTFVEIGSSMSEWVLREAHSLVAEAVLDALTSPEELCTIAVGVGGNHYAPIFTRRALEGREAYGHMIASYALKDLDDPELVQKVVREACIKSSVPTNKLVVEKKLKRSWRDALEKIATELNLQVEYV